MKQAYALKCFSLQALLVLLYREKFCTATGVLLDSKRTSTRSSTARRANTVTKTYLSILISYMCNEHNSVELARNGIIWYGNTANEARDISLRPEIMTYTLKYTMQMTSGLHGIGSSSSAFWVLLNHMDMPLESLGNAYVSLLVAIFEQNITRTKKYQSLSTESWLRVFDKHTIRLKGISHHSQGANKS